MLGEHKRIINIDEIVINSTDSKTQGWCKRNEKAFTVDIERIPSLNIIAGVSNHGEVFFTMNRGKTNSQTFKLYLFRLVWELS